MLNEIKIFFNNINKFRYPINEAVSDDKIINAINNYEYIYIYYAGDGQNKRGYRTIRPFLMGTHKTSGNKVLRAWQDRGRSADFMNRKTRPDSYEHDYWSDEEGIKPGWRMFRIDRIEKILPIGKRFVRNGKVMIPPKYNENDKDINREYWVSTKTPEKIVKVSTDPDEPNIDAHKVDKSEFNKQSKEFKKFGKTVIGKREATASDIEKIYNYVKKVYKKSPNDYIVYTNDNDDFTVINIKTAYKIPEDRIVGNLTTLYSTLVEPTKSIKQDEKNFFRDIMSDDE